ncbi:MAG TPA: hypothetical protein VHC68_02720 [Candidatus Paceibacterota bacterium]|nr:hypothetical protein [Candidatus Paceibacterota bacterium]
MIASEKRRALSYAVEFVRFAAGFALILALALIALHFATAASA